MGKEAVFQGGCFRGEDERVGKYGLFQDFFAGGAVKARPGIAPGFGAVSAVVDGVHGADEKGVACFQMVGVAAALVDAFAVEDHVEEVVWAHGWTEGVVRATVFLTAEVDGKSVLGVGFFFHLTGPPVFCHKSVISSSGGSSFLKNRYNSIEFIKATSPNPKKNQQHA